MGGLVFREIHLPKKPMEGVIKVARPSLKQVSRKDTENALMQALETNNINEKYYKDQVLQYMKYFDNLEELNDSLGTHMDIEILKEKRQVTKEMRSILDFLGLKPQAAGGGQFEEL